MRHFTIPLICSALLVFPAPLLAQDPDQSRQLQLAQSLEQAGEWTRASVLYEGLYRADSLNYVYFDALRRAYIQLKEYRKAIYLVQRRIVLRPGEAFLTAQLGGLTYDEGEPVRADSLWNVALLLQPANRQMYVIVAQQMQERRLYDKAIRTYEAGRGATRNPVDFVEELALLHSATQAYGSAVEEYLLLLRAAPHQLGYIQSRIASFTMKAEGVHSARTVVQAAVERTPADVPLRTLLAWLAIEQGDHAAALEQYRIIDRLANANGNELYGFGQRAMREQAFRTAADAFRDVIAVGSASPLFLPARLGYARAMEEIVVRDTAVHAETRAANGDAAESFPSLDQAVSLYREIVRDAPNSDAAVQALYRVGVIALERSFDLDGALAAFTQVQRLPRAGGLGWEAALAAAEVNIARNDLATASASLRTIPSGAPPEIRDRVVFKQAQIASFEARFDSALAILGTLAGAVDRDLANDAIGLQVFLQENRSVEAALAAFIRGDLLQRQRKYSEALSKFQGVVKDFPTALLLEDALLRTGELQVLLGRPAEAVAVFRRMFAELKTSMLRDRALFRAGDVTERSLRDHAGALEIYEQFLQEFPHSLFTEEVRQRIRRLRGDAS
ncbi:MAG: tetratricopeptide repeat protein [Bacteroidota bacterium]